MFLVRVGIIAIVANKLHHWLYKLTRHVIFLILLYTLFWWHAFAGKGLYLSLYNYPRSNAIRLCMIIYQISSFYNSTRIWLFSLYIMLFLWYFTIQFFFFQKRQKFYSFYSFSLATCCRVEFEIWNRVFFFQNLILVGSQKTFLYNTMSISLAVIYRLYLLFSIKIGFQSSEKWRDSDYLCALKITVDIK